MCSLPVLDLCVQIDLYTNGWTFSTTVLYRRHCMRLKKVQLWYWEFINSRMTMMKTIQVGHRFRMTRLPTLRKQSLKTNDWQFKSWVNSSLTSVRPHDNQSRWGAERRSLARHSERVLWLGHTKWFSACKNASMSTKNVLKNRKSPSFPKMYDLMNKMFFFVINHCRPYLNVTLNYIFIISNK